MSILVLLLFIVLGVVLGIISFYLFDIFHDPEHIMDLTLKYIFLISFFISCGIVIASFGKICFRIFEAIFLI